MNNEEIATAARTIQVEMVTLKARLPEPYRSNVEECENLAKKIIDEMEAR